MKTLDFILNLILFFSLILMIVGFFSPNKSLFWYPKKRTRLASFLIYFLICALSANLSTNQKENKLDNKKVINQVVILDSSKDKKEIKTPQNWSYSSDTDQMTSEKRYFAVCGSINMASFKFPYNGGSTFQLVIRKESNKRFVTLSVSKGQFVGSYNSNIRIKFDENKVESYSYSEPNDGSSDVIFINNENHLINKIKKANTLKIEAEFFQEGRVVIVFNVAGLKFA